MILLCEDLFICAHRAAVMGSVLFEIKKSDVEFCPHLLLSTASVQLKFNMSIGKDRAI